jgi:Asp-tRNA(Asn)/Glu-tRNA(Gln) amidotransferase A subunit family amidase
MGRSVADLERMSRVLFGKHGSGHSYFPAPVPYRDVTLPEKLRFGYYLNGALVHLRNIWLEGLTHTDKDGTVKGSPACHRAVLETVEALRKVGHECVEINPPDCAYTCRGFSDCHRTQRRCSGTGATIVYCNHLS